MTERAIMFAMLLAFLVVLPIMIGLAERMSECGL